MKSYFLLAEELTDVQKKTVDRWGGNAKATEISKHVFPEGHDRIEVPLIHQAPEPLEPHPAVEDHLEKHGFSVKDYRSGIAVDKHGRDVKIGKALEKTKASDEIKNTFANDPKRAASTQQGALKVIISKHPHDVAGMSTDRGWKSCMDMDGGAYADHLKHDVKNGTHVAYLVNNDDNEIKRPLARIALKPFKSLSGKHTILRPEGRGYGTSDSSFAKTVKEFTDKHFPATEEAYQKDGKLYDDDMRPFVVNDPKKALEKSNTHLHKHILRTPEYNSEVTSDHLHKMLKSRDPEVAALAAKHPNATGEHLDKALDHENPEVRGATFANKNATPAHIDKGLQDVNGNVRVHAVYHQNLTPEQISKVVNNNQNHPLIRTNAIIHQNATSEQIYQAMASDNMHVRRAAGNNPNITQEDLNKASEHPSWATREAAWRSPRATTYQFDKLKEHPASKEFHDSGALYDYMSKQQHELLIHHPDPDVRMKMLIHSHERMLPRHILHMTQDENPQIAHFAKGLADQYGYKMTGRLKGKERIEKP